MSDDDPSIPPQGDITDPVARSAALYLYCAKQIDGLYNPETDGPVLVSLDGPPWYLQNKRLGKKCLRHLQNKFMFFTIRRRRMLTTEYLLFTPVTNELLVRIYGNARNIYKEVSRSERVTEEELLNDPARFIRALLAYLERASSKKSK